MRRRFKLLAALLILGITISLSGCKQKYRRQEPPAAARFPDQESIFRANQLIIRKYATSISEKAASNGWHLSETGTGVFYQLIDRKRNTQQGNIETGDRISLSFKLSLLDGTLCYSSKKQGVKQFFVDKSEAEPGLHEAVKFLQPGDSARIIIPPQRAFGLTGDGNLIPPRAILVYEVRIDSVIRHLNN